VNVTLLYLGSAGYVVFPYDYCRSTATSCLFPKKVVIISTVRHESGSLLLVGQNTIQTNICRSRCRVFVVRRLKEIATLLEVQSASHAIDPYAVYTLKYLPQPARLHTCQGYAVARLGRTVLQAAALRVRLDVSLN
jgi:hypothetical protein